LREFLPLLAIERTARISCLDITRVCPRPGAAPSAVITVVTHATMISTIWVRARVHEDVLASEDFSHPV